METFHHILKLSVGVGLFFCYILEESLKTFLEEVFFLQRITKNAIGAVTGV
jgi:hypothetical protein